MRGVFALCYKWISTENRFLDIYVYFNFFLETSTTRKNEQPVRKWVLQKVIVHFAKITLKTLRNKKFLNLYRQPGFSDFLFRKK